MLKNSCSENISPGSHAGKSREATAPGEMMVPDSIEIETDSRCNRSCPYCPANKKDLDRGSGKMPDAVFEKIITGLADYEYSGIIRPHLFNEPLLDPRLPEFMRFITKSLPSVDIEILSNGDFLDVQTYNSLVDAGVKVIRVTQHGARPTAKMNELLEYLFKNVNIENRLRYRVFAEKAPLANRGGLVEPEVVNVNPQAICEWPMENMAINFKGHVLLCCNDFMGQHIFGNAASENIIDIWNSEKFIATRRRLQQGDLFLEICRKCQGLE
ncbi:MAG: hypothetical protein GF350_09575 [Chitinivibrionales bacterium]|nr:hypothetical protein [Chitinivibrionales bacterium]